MSTTNNNSSRSFRPPLAGYLAIKYKTQTYHDVDVMLLRHQCPPAEHVTKLVNKRTIRNAKRLTVQLRNLLQTLQKQYTNNENNDDRRLDSIVFFPIDHWVLRKTRNRLNYRKLWVDPTDKLEEYVMCQWENRRFDIEQSVSHHFHGYMSAAASSSDNTEWGNVQSYRNKGNPLQTVMSFSAISFDADTNSTTTKTTTTESSTPRMDDQDIEIDSEYNTDDDHSYEQDQTKDDIDSIANESIV